MATSEDPDEIRRDRIHAMGAYPQRVLIATDCLSEGINLHERFSALVEKKRFGVVYPVVPMDVLGMCVLMPAFSAS